MIKRFYQRFSKPVPLAMLNGILIATSILFNTYFQVFCIPTTWATVVLAICFTNTVLYPLFAHTQLAPFTSFINGMGLFVYSYCILFLEQMNFIGLFLSLVGIGLVTYIPHFLAVQIIWRNLIKAPNKTSKIFFLTAIALCTAAVFLIGNDYKKAIASIEEFKKSHYTKLQKNFMTEKILGMHFIYHTRFCEYDGWRPPKQEPIMVIGMWLNHRTDPLPVNLKTRLELYKKFFPQNKFKFDCSCGLQYSQDYHQDDLWKR